MPGPSSFGVGHSLSYKLVLGIGNFTRGIDGANRKLQDLNTRTAKASDGLASMAAAGVVATTAFAGLVGTMSALAADAEETQNLFEVSMGNMAQAGEDFANEFSDSVGGLDTFEIKGMLGTFNLMINNMGLAEESAFQMSKQLTALAFDMSSLRNIRVDEAFLKIQSGLSGELEPLKRLGIVVSDAMTRQRAVTLGFIEDTNDYLSEAEKVYARYTIIMDQTTADQGDLARTQDSVANSSRILISQVRRLAIEIGDSYKEETKELLLFLRDVVRATTDWVTANKDLVSQIVITTGKILAFVSATGGLAMGAIFVQSMVVNFARLPYLIGKALFFTKIWGVHAGIVVGAISAIGAAVILLNKDMRESNVSFADWVRAIIATVNANLQYFFELSIFFFKKLWESAKNFFTKLFLQGDYLIDFFSTLYKSIWDGVWGER